MERPSIHQTLSRVCRSPVRSLTALNGGCIASVYEVVLDNGQRRVAKTLSGGVDLTTEGQMLNYLANHTELPVPQVVHASQNLLVMEHIPNNASLSQLSQRDAAGHLAHLHAISADHFGFDWNTVIGPLCQINQKTTEWIPFFRDHRLIAMTEQAWKSGRLPSGFRRRLLSLAGHLGDYLIEPDRPGLIHGDLWAGNILCFDNKIAAFIDPALYFADPEIELAFATLFSTFDGAFFDTYQAHRPIKPGFFEQRCGLYNLYPLLVHLCLFGGTYAISVDTTLKRFGF